MTPSSFFFTNIVLSIWTIFSQTFLTNISGSLWHPLPHFHKYCHNNFYIIFTNIFNNYFSQFMTPSSLFVRNIWTIFSQIFSTNISGNILSWIFEQYFQRIFSTNISGSLWHPLPHLHKYRHRYFQQIFQAVYDTLFLIFTNIVYTGAAVLAPHQVLLPILNE